MRNLLVLSSVLLLGTPVAEAQTARLLAPAAGDVAVTGELVAQPLPRGLEIPSERAALSWAVESDLQLETPRPHVTRSREYWVDVTARDLRAGVPLLTDAPGVLVRVNPAPGSDRAGERAIPAEMFEIRTAGAALAGERAMDLLVGQEQMRATGVPFAEGTTAFRLRDDVTGPVTLAAPRLRAEDDAPYVVHVFDRASDSALELTASADTVLAGDRLTIVARWAHADTKAFGVDSIDGFVVSPAGRTFPLEFRALRDGRWGARLAPDADAVPSPALWEAHVMSRSTVGDAAVQRFARTSFAVAAPTARLDARAASWSLDESGLAVTLPMEIGADGRYEARGVLFGTTDAGLVPVGIAHSAARLAPGHDALELRWDAAWLDGVSAPFEVRDLRLVDQARMGVLHRQARGLALTH